MKLDKGETYHYDSHIYCDGEAIAQVSSEDWADKIIERYNHFDAMKKLLERIASQITNPAIYNDIINLLKEVNRG